MKQLGVWVTVVGGVIFLCSLFEESIGLNMGHATQRAVIWMGVIIGIVGVVVLAVALSKEENK